MLYTYKSYFQILWTAIMAIIAILIDTKVMPAYCSSDLFMWQLIVFIIELAIWSMIISWLNDYRPKKRQSSHFWR